MSRRSKLGTNKVTVGWLHPGEYAYCFAESMKDMMFYDVAKSRHIMGHPHGTVAKQCSSAGIVEGRNKVAKAFLDETDSDWLLWIDSDMGFAADTCDRLLAAAHPTDRPVVGGLCFAASADGNASFHGMRHRATPTLYDFVETDDQVGFTARLVYPADEVVQVGATGSAMLLIHRSVLVGVRERFGDHWYTPITHPKGPTTFSEDLSFCVRVQSIDRSLWVHTGVKTTHDKGFAFLDEDYYVAQEIAAGRRPVP